MAEQYELNLVSDRNSVYDTARMDPNVVYEIRDQGQGMEQLVKSLDGFLNAAHKSLDKETVRKAQLAGAMAGLEPNFQTAEGDSLAAEAYNRAGTEIFVNKKIADVSTSINKIAIDPGLRNNPTQMQHVLEEKKAEFVKDIPIAALPDFMVAYNDRMQRAIQGAQQNQVQMTISANAGQFAETEAALLAEITNAARAGDEAAIAQARTEYFNSIDRQVGLSLMPEEASKKKIALQQQVQKDAIIGDFLRTPADDRPAFVESFLKDNPLQEILQASEVDDLKREMIQAWNVDENLADAAKEETEKLQTATIDTIKTDFHLAPTVENYTKLITSPGVKPEDIKAARIYLNQYATEPDPIAKMEVEDLIYKGQYAEATAKLNEPETAPRLGQKAMQELRGMITTGADGGGFEQTEAYKEVTRRINEDYSDELGLGSAGKAIRQQIYDKMRTDYPKYLRGEIPYDDVDPVRMYKLKQNNLNDTTKTQAGATVRTKQGDVVIPQKYVDDPAQYAVDRDTMDPRLKSIEVQKYMADLRIQREKEAKTKGQQ